MFSSHVAEYHGYCQRRGRDLQCRVQRRPRTGREQVPAEAQSRPSYFLRRRSMRDREQEISARPLRAISTSLLAAVRILGLRRGENGTFVTKHRAMDGASVGDSAVRE